MKLQTDLREFVELLTSRAVDFLIVGGHAVAFHGYPRFTGDIDVLIRPTADNAERVLGVLEAFGFGGLGIDVETLVAPNKVIQLGRPPNRIDLLTSVSGIGFEEAWDGRVQGEIDGVAVWFPSREALIENKRAAGRPKDLADIAALTPEGT